MHNIYYTKPIIVNTSWDQRSVATTSYHRESYLVSLAKYVAAPHKNSRSFFTLANSHFRPGLLCPRVILPFKRFANIARQLEAPRTKDTRIEAQLLGNLTQCVIRVASLIYRALFKLL